MKLHSILVFLLLASCSQEKDKTLTQSTDFCSNIHRNDSITLSEELKDLKELMSTKTGVYVLEDSAGSLVTRAWLSEFAEKTIDIQYFIFSIDNVGLIACDYLVRAANRGVKVRILVDDIMVDTGIEEVLSLDAHKNISIKIYNPGVNLGKNIFSKIHEITTNFRSANQRMHNKTFLVDGKVVITGGRNLADEYFDYDHEYNFKDRDVLLLGKVTNEVNTSFNKFWDSDLSVPIVDLSDGVPEGFFDENRFNKLHEYACNPKNFWPQVRTRIEKLPIVFQELRETGELVWVDNVSFISDLPGKNDGSNGLGGGGVSTSALIYLVKNAKRSIDIQTPYLITTELSQNLFREAVKRGVTVRILTNSLASTDNIEAFSGYQSDRTKLLETGLRIFEFRPDGAKLTKEMTNGFLSTLEHKPKFGLHSKSMVVDGEITVIGTFNLDPRSANLNTECVTVIHSKEISSYVLKNMEDEFKPENSWETTLNYNPDSEVSKFKRINTWTRKIIPKNIL